MSRLKSLIQEIHRRSLWQVLGIYLGGAWVALQGIEALVSVLGLPEWVPGLAVGDGPRPVASPILKEQPPAESVLFAGL
jgi:hypothetical protein